MNEIQKLNRHRQLWHKKLQSLSEDIMMASLEQNSDLFEELLTEFETSALILYRFDRKLREARALIAQ